ncbi:MAG: PAS domain S-box protein, partial [bacterium]
MARLLGLLADQNHISELVREVTILLQDWSSCEAVGVRLQDGDDFPYFETRGFPPEFVQAENELCAVDQKGELIRDSEGNPVIECMCGNVICERFDPELPFFTEYGSFWTNSTSELLASTSDAERQARTRNTCNGEGYESVALVPLRAEGETFGLLQFNDPRKGMFTEKCIGLLEDLARGLALGLSQRRTRREVRRRRDEMQALLDVLSGSSFLMGPDGKILECNEPLASNFGTTREAMLGENIYDFLPPEVAEHRRGKVRLAMQVKAPVEFEDGCLGRRFSNRLVPVLDKAEHIIALAVYATDITEHCRQKQLRDRITRVLKAIRSIDRLIVREEYPKRLIERACMTLVGTLGYSAAGIALLDERGTVKATAMSGSNGRVASMCIQLADGKLPPCVMEALDCETAFAVLDPDCCEGGTPPDDDTVSACRITADGNNYGVLLVSTSQQHDVSEEEQGLLEELADDLGLGLHKIANAKALCESEEKYRSPVQEQHDLVCRFDTDGKPVFVNEAYCRFFGVRQNAILAGSFMPLVYKDDRSVAAKALKRFRSTGEDATIERRVYRSDGDVRWIQWSTRGIRDAQGRVVEFQGVGRDVTERRMVEQALRESEERFRALVECSPMPIALVREGRYIYANPAAGKLLGFADPAELTGVEVMTSVGPEFHGVVSQRKSHAESGKSNDTAEIRVLQRDGGSVWVLSSSVPVQVDGQSATIIVAQDITLRKRAELQLLEYQRQLQDLAAALSKTEDQERRRIAEGLHDEVGQSLAALSLHLQSLKSANLPPSQASDLSRANNLVRQVSKTLRTLIFELCPPMLYESGLAAALTWLTEHFKQAHKEAQLIFDLAPEVPELPEELRAFAYQAARELLRNAERHASAETIRLSVKADGEAVKLTVEDDGVGFDPASL